MQKLREQCNCQYWSRPCLYHEGVEDAYNRIMTIIDGHQTSAAESNRRLRAFLRKQLVLDYMKEKGDG